jgi:hypothetical protein
VQDRTFHEGFNLSVQVQKVHTQKGGKRKEEGGFQGENPLPVRLQIKPQDFYLEKKSVKPFLINLSSCLCSDVKFASFWLCQGFRTQKSIVNANVK